MSLFRDKGVVLRTYRLGEADKIIVFLTERHGKVGPSPRASARPPPSSAAAWSR